MQPYTVPLQSAEAAFSEKRSRFIAQLWRIRSEEEARQHIAQAKKKYYDARHNCWCYLLHQGGIVRFSDDGEPQGTAGQPMLSVFQRQEVWDACCVVTRYFGGVLLGAGGLVRCYSRAAAEALKAAGAARLTPWTLWDVPCTYPLLERVRGEIAAAGGTVQESAYDAAVTLRAAFPPGGAEIFASRLQTLSAGALSMTAAGEVLLPSRQREAPE